ncbi:lytic transglycosylase domain-containing protein [Ochrobactrum sp. WV_118_8]|uniref:Lytic transglycosylase domain-containing protein n=1 Tax=Brucella tritici TaxID=94626 RepID=A0A7V7VQ68_9HYPH|nr:MULTISPECIES: lytic transglycosylase domain-containing protein [Brucella/Ochrobactrum group]KAB2654648.1 lytic transglycosylase domain-containing protein [Brucella tritici]KAB2756756.1 lytic transglycosylase domain-containing protein [Brucella anthropi]KAB2773782.1 lytic transglycosylase domain-containing protein [Brucella anthropi]MCQ9147842.1 lytic transglycosylase domain-containing protein [Ochrobactrum sp. BTU2]MCR8493861.1 lytic transglycosylase domain-containing protein [Brucella anth
MERLSIKALLLSATLFIPFGIAATCAEERGAIAPFAQDGDAEAATHDASGSRSDLTVFNRRWTSKSKEFVVGSDGIVSAENKSGNGTNTNNHIGNVSSAVIATGSLASITNPAISLQDESARLGDLRFTKQAAVSTPECGPSPLSPEEIKTLVEQAARRHQVDALFATAITWAESQFDRSRNSDKGARGPMQLMPGTAERFGVRDVCDPASNIEGGVKYLRVLLDEFQNPLLVAAAYNAGEGRIYEYGGVPPFRETVGYVAKVVNYQLGVTMPAPKKKLVASGRRSSPIMASETQSGVIAVKKTGTFVGGVMHF